jgi:hypothetical protein
MKQINWKTSMIVLSGLLLLTTKTVFGDHLPPITPVLPGEDRC